MSESPDWLEEAIKADRNTAGGFAVLAFLISVLCGCFCYLNATEGRVVYSAILGLCAFASVIAGISHAGNAWQDNKRLLRIEKRKRDASRRWGMTLKL